MEDVRALAKIRKPLAQMHDEVREIVGQRNAPMAPEVRLMPWGRSLRVGAGAAHDAGWRLVAVV
ncbi:hypothetical protein [Cupriavidus sp. D39]|uniref:hypothetical protein n=1 Tax=Cupriavidus sp. D39 TaxID=2997877 RepID=UPI00226E0973|nr:hypothetical protein [Cupriavidus sp. D39]MCY0854921.1 hypothetical protein [Cupriavidus sp. D39]